MRLDGQYDARADIAWLRFESYDAGAAIDEETEHDLLRQLDPPTGRTVGVTVRHAREHLPTEFLRMLERSPRQTATRRRRHAGLAHHQALEQLHDAWG